MQNESLYQNPLHLPPGVIYILHTVKLVVLLLTYSQMGTTEAVFQTFNVNVLRMSHFHLFASTIMETLVGMNQLCFFRHMHVKF